MADQQEPFGFFTRFFSSIPATVWATLVVALLSVGGALKVALINAAAQREVALFNASAQRTLEREQFASNLVVKAISAGDNSQSVENLQFLVKAHLLDKKSVKVSELLRDSSFHFYIPADRAIIPTPKINPPKKTINNPSLNYIDPVFSGIVVDAVTLRPLNGVTVSVKTRRSRMRDIEAKITGADGRFTLHYPPRNYILSCIHPGYAEHNSQHMAAGKFAEPLILKMERIN
jgi:hypothetical protein